MSDNSKIEIYSPFVKVDDPNNILFIIHRRGFITCICGNVVTKHVCNLQTNFKNLKIKFDLCPKKEETCRFCEDIAQWRYERYMNKEGDDKLYCRKCTKEIKSDKGICEDCFCSTCYSHLNDCVCCKFCPVFSQCICYKDEKFLDSADEKSDEKSD